ncbi:MAG TPA: c-type cytochrome [Candidatus Limnocylindria bacterium]|nr:c-type cytochrome [Candidatus Limnocylindria bacterium]
MRLKTLGVLLTTALAAFTMLYWFTDTMRRDQIAQQQQEELAEFGEVIFSNDPTQPAAAACARCHGPEGEGGPIPNDPDGRQAPSLHTASLANKLRVNPNYVRLAVSYGGVVVSGNVNSPMPAWSAEVGGPLNEQQIDAVVALVEGWAKEAGENAPEEVENTVEAGQEVYSSAGCAGCHGADLEGGVGPNLQTIGSELVTDLPAPPSGLDQMESDYDEDPANFLELWIRDSAGNYNDGNPTGMPPHPEDTINDSQMQALITFLLDQTGD